MIRRLFSKEIVFGMMLSIIAVSSHAAPSVSCTVTSNEVNFGSYDVFSNSPLNSSGTVKVRCSPGNTNYTVSLNNGLNGPITNRRMKNSMGNGTIQYNLYTDATYATVWGDGTGGGVVVNGSQNTDFTVYGRIPPQQDVGVGTYSDVITVTVAF